MSPIEYFLGSCLLVEDVHNLQIEITRRLGCEKLCGGHISCARTPPCVIYTIRVTLDDPPWNCKNDFSTTQRKGLTPLGAYSPPISQ